MKWKFDLLFTCTLLCFSYSLSLCPICSTSMSHDLPFLASCDKINPYAYLSNKLHCLSGSGGGWEGGTNKSKEGHTLLQGAVGGQPCREALETYQWQVYGGFGGGGGGCTAGGGGGGYSGGNVSITDDPGHNGQGGSSYISPMAIKPVFEPGR